MPHKITFSKTGQEVKPAIAVRQQQLQARLEKRNQVLDAFLQDPRKVRSYMVLSHRNDAVHMGRGGYALFSQDDISSEEKREIQQLCARIFEIEQELHRLSLIVAHLNDNQVLELTIEDLIGYGFNAGTSIEGDVS